MKLTLRRIWQHPTCTQGTLSLDGLVHYFTLEDVIREIPGEAVEKWKVPGETAIPAGTYSLVIDWSNRFKRPMPHVLNVPGFDGIRIHSGNTAEDTEGCILVGERRIDDNTLGDSHAAFMALMALLESAKDLITIEIVNPPQSVEAKIWPT